MECLYSDLGKVAKMHIKAFVGRHALIWIQAMCAKTYSNHHYSWIQALNDHERIFTRAEK